MPPRVPFPGCPRRGLREPLAREPVDGGWIRCYRPRPFRPLWFPQNRKAESECRGTELTVRLSLIEADDRSNDRSMARVMMTGAGGCIGSPLVGRFAPAGSRSAAAAQP